MSISPFDREERDRAVRHAEGIMASAVVSESVVEIAAWETRRWNATVQAAEAERDECRDRRNEVVEACFRAEAERDRDREVAQVEREELVRQRRAAEERAERLVTYTRHETNCHWWGSSLSTGREPGPCTCGLSAALAVRRSNTPQHDADRIRPHVESCRPRPPSRKEH